MSPNELESVHVCPACEDEQSSAKAFVMKVAGSSVALTPIFMLALKFASAAMAIAFPLDDKLTYVILGAYTIVVACFFKDAKK